MTNRVHPAGLSASGHLRPQGRSRLATTGLSGISYNGDLETSFDQVLPCAEDLNLTPRSLLNYNKLSDALIAKARQQRHLSMTTFIQEFIRRKECVNFVPKKDPKRKPDDPVKCHCGEIAENHVKGAAGVKDFFQNRAAEGLKLFDSVGGDVKLNLPEPNIPKNGDWKFSRDIQEFNTNAFGKIAFINEGLGGHKPSKFVRVADNTPVELVIDFMLEHWRMSQPNPANLVITVIGGAKNFKLDGKKKEVFNRGLVNAAQTTSAWIITSGFNMGVMKAVGEAVAEGQSYNWDKLGMTHSLRCVGIAPWGYVERRDALISQDRCGSWNATYRVNNVIRHGHPVSLNPDHTHFLFVDDGYRGRYGGVAEFRASLERKIARPQEPEDGGESGLGIPVVLVVVEGGYDAILDVQKSLKQRIPVVICEGTGRAADIISYAYSHTVTTRHESRVLKERHRRVLEDKLRTAFGKTWAQRGDEQKETEKYLNIIIECCQDEKLITVFDMNKHEDLDLAILSALLKGQGASNVVQLYDQLKLALTWNRSDVAEDKIFNNQITWPQGYLDDIMTQALIENKMNFVRLLLQNGDVVMHEYLTVPRLRKLYNSAPNMSHLRMLLRRKTRYPIFLLQDVDKLLRKLMSKHVDDHYNNDNDIRAVMLDEDAYTGPPDQIHFPKPFRELFIWAVLMNRKMLAKFLWERCDEAIPSAIAASKIYESLADQVAAYDSDLLKNYKDNKLEFEQLAIKVLDECQTTDPEKAAMLIRHKYATWGDVDCLQMAASADNKEFLSTVCCQNMLDIMWKRGVTAHWVKMGLSIVFFPLIPWLVRFQTLDETHEERSVWRKVKDFYSAPATKFTATVMMYLIFLMAYSYMILFEFRPEMRILEMIVLIWMGTFLIEEVREMLFNSQADRLVQRIYEWWHFSFFNRIDLLILLVGIIGIVLRLIPGQFINAKTCYAVNCVLLFIRLLRDYSASSYLGPKLVMITKMMEQLVLYIMIILVFLLAYGIAIHAVMFPSRDFYPNIFRDIFYYPYWQISGELFLEEIEGTSSECESATRINGTKFKSNGDICPEFSWLVPALTAGYLLMANVLLLNLLIAIFTHVFEEVETNSIQIWKYGMYFLVVEYDNKPCLAPPFIVFEHVYLISKWIFTRTCCAKKVEKKHYAARQLQLMQVFEKEMTRTYIRKTHKQENKASAEKTVIKIMHGVNEVTKLLEEEKVLREKEEEKLLEQQVCGMERRMSTLSLVGSVSSTVSTTPHRFSRWPSLEKLRQLKDLGLRAKLSQCSNLQSIQEDQVSDGGNSTAVPGYCSESGMDSMAEVTSTDYNFRSKLNSDSENDLTKKYDRPKFTLDPETSMAENDEQSSRPSTAPVSRTKAAVSEAGVERSPEPARKLKRRKSKKRKEPKQFLEVETSDMDSTSGRQVRAEYRRICSQDLSDDDSDGNDELKRSIRRQLIERQTSMEVKQMNIVSEESASGAAMVSRIESIEQKLEQIEEKTSQSLYNIETMLRNAVFNRATTHVPPPTIETENYTDGAFRGLGGLAPSRANVSPPPYRRNLQFPQ